MPPELEDMDWDAIAPEGMTDLTLSEQYNQVWTAREAGMLPEEFRMLPWDEQAELIAFYFVHNRIKAFYAEEQTQLAKRKQAEIEAQANARSHQRR